MGRGVFPIDEVTIEWLRIRDSFIQQRGLWKSIPSGEGVPSDADGNSKHPRINEERIFNLEKNIVKADEDAFYSKEILIDLSSIQPYVQLK